MAFLLSSHGLSKEIKVPKLICKCGVTIDLSPIPCPDERFLIDASDMESVFEAIDEDTSKAEELLETRSQSVIVCKSCGRYYVSKGDSNEYSVLVPEAPATNDVTEAND